MPEKNKTKEEREALELTADEKTAKAVREMQNAQVKRGVIC